MVRRRTWFDRKVWSTGLGCALWIKQFCGARIRSALVVAVVLATRHDHIAVASLDARRRRRRTCRRHGKRTPNVAVQRAASDLQSPDSKNFVGRAERGDTRKESVKKDRLSSPDIAVRQAGRLQHMLIIILC